MTDEKIEARMRKVGAERTVRWLADREAQLRRHAQMDGALRRFSLWLAFFVVMILGAEMLWILEQPLP